MPTQTLDARGFDIGWNAGEWSELPLTMPAYDLKYGSYVLRGDPRVLDRIPEWAPAAMPKGEALTLLLNRSAGLLSGLRVDSGGAGLVASDPRYLSNQITRAVSGVSTRSRYGRKVIALSAKHLIWGTLPPENYAVH